MKQIVRRRELEMEGVLGLVFVFSRFKKRWNIVPRGKEVKGYCIRSKSRLWSSLPGNGRYKDGCKTSTNGCIRDSYVFERHINGKE